MLINDTATTEMYTLSYTTLFRSEIWVEVRPNRNEEVDAQPDRHHERRRNEKPRTKQGARLGEQHVHAHRRCREDAHQMVGRREGEQVDDEDEVMIAPGAHRLVRPPH